MPTKRVIARLDIKGEQVIKGIHLDGLRPVGLPEDLASKYVEDGADELLFIDSVASLYGRNQLLDLIKRTATRIFIPMTVGGGIRSVEDARQVLAAGGDKVAVNSAAIKRPELITELANVFGKQCVVVSIQAKRTDDGSWEAMTDSARDRSGLNVIDWIHQVMVLGAGEILVTSVDKDGTLDGLDHELIGLARSVADIPIQVSGGAREPADVIRAFLHHDADAVCIGGALHYNRTTISDIKQLMLQNSIEVRS